MKASSSKLDAAETNESESLCRCAPPDIGVSTIGQSKALQQRAWAELRYMCPPLDQGLTTADVSEGDA